MASAVRTLGTDTTVVLSDDPATGTEASENANGCNQQLPGEI